MSLYRRKDSKVWWISIKTNCKRIRISTNTQNKKLAEQIHEKILTEVTEDRWFEQQTKKRMLKEMIERYQEEYTENKDYYSKARDKSIFKHIVNYFGDEAKLKDVEEKVGQY